MLMCRLLSAAFAKVQALLVLAGLTSFSRIVLAAAPEEIPRCPHGFRLTRHTLEHADMALHPMQELMWIYHRHEWSHPIVQAYCVPDAGSLLRNASVQARPVAHRGDLASRRLAASRTWTKRNGRHAQPGAAGRLRGSKFKAISHGLGSPMENRKYTHSNNSEDDSSNQGSGINASSADPGLSLQAHLSLLQPLLRDNLHVDLRVWLEARAVRGPLQAADLLAYAKASGNTSTTKLVMVRQHTLTFPLAADTGSMICPRPCDPHLATMTSMLASWVSRGSRPGQPAWPEGLYLLHSQDFALCRNIVKCRVPALSLIKKVSTTHASSPDILVPPLGDAKHPLYQLPWHLKEPTAFFRGTGYCPNEHPKHSLGVCTRVFLANVTDMHLPNSPWATYPSAAAVAAAVVAAVAAAPIEAGSSSSRSSSTRASSWTRVQSGQGQRSTPKRMRGRLRDSQRRQLLNPSSWMQGGHEEQAQREVLQWQQQVHASMLQPVGSAYDCEPVSCGGHPRADFAHQTYHGGQSPARTTDEAGSWLERGITSAKSAAVLRTHAIRRLHSSLRSQVRKPADTSLLKAMLAKLTAYPQAFRNRSLNQLPIDVGMVAPSVRGPRKHAIALCASGRGSVPLAVHARFKAVLSVEGLSASSRVAKLLHTGSALFKQESGHVEWYYRSLKEGEHYFGYYKNSSLDILQLAGRLLDGSAESESSLQRVAAAGQAFAARYLSLPARQAYYFAAMQAYTALFEGMEDVLQQLDRMP